MRYTVIDEEELTSALRDAAREMGGAIWQAFEDMERYELYDFTISEKKGNMSYQCYLYSYDQPFIIVKTEGWSDDILNCGHELGHFVDAWYNHNGTDSEDLAEVFSQGMEYLLLSRVSKRYREELTEYKLLDTVDTLSQQASFAAFEHEIYARPAAEWTPEAINELSLELAREYGYLVEGMEDYYAKSWFDISHFFDTPFYIISYCVSIDAAFQIYELDCSENAGLERWNKLLPRDRDGFLDTVVDQGGLEDPFAADRMQEIAALLREKLK
jgi:oligoendopeptidase F